MKFINDLKSIEKNRFPCVATIGNFDGLHLGHQTIIKNLKNVAQRLELPLTVISFEPLPAEYFVSNQTSRIYPLRDKIKRMEDLNVDNFLCLKFNKQLANTEPKEFIESILINHLDVKYLSVGDDFRFGYKRGGDFKLLKEIGLPHGMVIEDTKTQIFDDERISSTRIRDALKNGDITTSNKLLGHKYQLSGRVRHGNKKGRTIDFPTVNLKIPQNIAARNGVYAVTIHGLTKSPLKGVSNIGIRPTLNGTEKRLETYIFDFDQQVYGQYICIELDAFIRAEKRFDSFDDLKKQIKIDIEVAKKLQ